MALLDKLQWQTGVFSPYGPAHSCYPHLAMEDQQGPADWAITSVVPTSSQLPQALLAMFRLACRVEGDGHKEHNPTFELDEGCLPVGVAILAEAVLRRLHE